MNPRALGTLLALIALTRALYDQMAPQLCPFYVPENKTEVSQLLFVDLGDHYGAEIWAPRRQQPATGQTATQRFRFPAGEARTIAITTP